MAQRALLIIMMIFTLGQSVLASADVHQIFEQGDIHHLDHSEAHDSSHDTGDDCGHSCFSHGAATPLFSKNHYYFFSQNQNGWSIYQQNYQSHYADPRLRPPIA